MLTRLRQSHSVNYKGEVKGILCSRSIAGLVLEQFPKQLLQLQALGFACPREGRKVEGSRGCDGGKWVN